MFIKKLSRTEELYKLMGLRLIYKLTNTITVKKLLEYELSKIFPFLFAIIFWPLLINVTLYCKQERAMGLLHSDVI